MTNFRISTLCLSLALLMTASASHSRAEESKKANVHEFSIEALEKDGKKYWIPTAASLKEGASFDKADGVKINVNTGDTVVFHLVSKIKGANNIHGFAIDAYKIEALVDDKGLVGSKEKEIRFVADKPGKFKIRCHLHPAHVGGELDVK